MARHGIVALLAATILGVNVNAGPCKPYSSAALSSTVTVEPTVTGSSTITADVTETTDALQTTVTEATTDVTDTTDVIETTITESATETTGTLETTVIETTATGTTDLVETTTTEAAIEMSTAVLVPTTTTAAGPVCEPTQILVNPGFDDNNNGSPWILGPGASVSQVNPRSPPNFMYNTLTQSSTSSTISQELPALGPFTYELQYYFNLQTAVNGRGFSCTVTPTINEQTLAPGQTLTDSGPYGFRLSSQSFIAQDPDSPAALFLTVHCQGTFNTVIIGIDDVSLTRVCQTVD
ncbi:hypothetical protein FSPOR_3124 [Fusarium sporotrichioides]|uniref:Uncharacterized protein n=1 Tax=Fusarium sporotrichioides TaxID=5514 RepID=A0A395SH95_FUSSP|nr:hypothetical protein FSPOR_3124 [Fusarium sporotrichioides]